MSDRIQDTPIIRRPDWEAAMPAELRALGVRCFRMGDARIMLGKEPEGWHLSISCADRDPTWDEIVTARYRICSTLCEDMVMHFPKLSEYVNVHPFTFHLHEAKPKSMLILPGGA